MEEKSSASSSHAVALAQVLSQLVFSPDQRVVATGLSSEMYNGKKGVIVKSEEAKGRNRVGVRFDDKSLGVKALKPENLKIVTAEGQVLGANEYQAQLMSFLQAARDENESGDSADEEDYDYVVVHQSKCVELNKLPTQQELKKLSRERPDLQALTISHDDPDEGPTLSFEGVKFPKLLKLELKCCSTHLSFNHKWLPELRELYLEGLQEESFTCDLPKLTRLRMDYVELEFCPDFGPSLSRSPELKYVSGHKLWGLQGGIHQLFLPELRSFKLSRSDSLQGLEIYAPKMRYLGLTSCYDVSHLKFLETCEKYNTPATSRFQVDVENICDHEGKVRPYLINHPRVQWINWRVGGWKGEGDGREHWTGDMEKDMAHEDADDYDWC